MRTTVSARGVHLWQRMTNWRCTFGFHDWQPVEPTSLQRRDYANATAQLYWGVDVPDECWDRACMRCGDTQLRMDIAIADLVAERARERAADEAEWAAVIEAAERTAVARHRVEVARRVAYGHAATCACSQCSSGLSLSDVDDHQGALSDFDARLGTLSDPD